MWIDGDPTLLMILDRWSYQSAVGVVFNWWFAASRVPLRKPRVRVAFPVMLLMWHPHCRSWLMVTPRYFPLSTTSSWCPWSVYTVCRGWCLLLILMTVHFSGRKHICHFCSHASREVTSFWSWSASLWLRNLLYTRQSSAKSAALDVEHLGGSFISQGTKVVLVQSPGVLRIVLLVVLVQSPGIFRIVLLVVTKYDPQVRLIGPCSLGSPWSRLGWYLTLRSDPASGVSVGAGLYQTLSTNPRIWHQSGAPGPWF
jgi:hypothetical protein